MNSKNKLMVAGAALASAAVAAGAAWYFSTSAAHLAPGATPAVATEKEPVKFVTLDNVVVMLRRAPGEGGTHYLSANLVLATSEEKAKQVKEHLPLLRSLTVGELSALTLSAASSMTVTQVGEQLNKSFSANYAQKGRDKPFSEVMLARLIIE